MVITMDLSMAVFVTVVVCVVQGQSDDLKLDVPRFDVIPDLKQRIDLQRSANYLLLPHIYRAFIYGGADPQLLQTVSEVCQNSLTQYYHGLEQKEAWAWKMYDSTGKQNSGIFFGATTWTGNYDECLGIMSNDCTGKCRYERPAPHFCSVHMTQAPWMPRLISKLELPFSVPASPFIVDVCVPINCSEADIGDIVGAFLEIDNFDDNITVKDVLCHQTRNIKDDVPALLCFIILCIVLSLVILGTGYDIYRRRHKVRVKHGPEITIGYDLDTDKYGILKILVSPRKRSRLQASLEASDSLKRLSGLPEYVHLEESHHPMINVTSQKSELENIPEDIEMTERSAAANGSNLHTEVHDQEPVAEDNISQRSGSMETLPMSEVEKNPLAPRVNRQHSIIEVRPSHRTKKLTSSENIFTDLLLSFSFRKNTRHILADGSADTLYCLNGVRVLSIAWIVLGNVYGILYQDPELVDNHVSAVKMTQTWWMQLVINTTLAADSFFVLSGTLGAYNFLKFKTKAGKNEEKDLRKVMSLKEYFFMIVHRLVRIFPCYAVLLMLGTNLMPYLGRGPRWSSDIENVKVCKRNWWSNVLFISNFYDPDNMCLPHTYYLSNDFQFFLLSPLILIPLLIKPKLGFTVIGFFLALQIMVVCGLNQGINGNVLKLRQNNYWSLIYVKPYSRIGVYCIGLGLGYFLFVCDRQMKFRKPVLYGGWLVACTVLFLLPYITYVENREGGRAWSGVETGIYEAFSRPAWALSLAWVIFACSTGQGAFVGKFLSWNFFLPLCRITYGVFLLHPILIHVVIESSYHNFYLNLGQLVYTYIAMFVCSYGIAFILITFIESPCTSFESHIRLRFKTWQTNRKMKNLMA